MSGNIIRDRRRQLLFLVLFLFFFSRNVRKVLISLEEKEDESLSTSNDAKVVPMVIKKLERLNHGPMKTLDPFLFLVYHKDFYPPGTRRWV